MKPLAINAEMSLLDLPFLERVKTLADQGFRVGLWGLEHLDVDALAAIGANFSMCDGFGRGNLVETEQADALVASIVELIPRVVQLGRPVMNLHGAKLSSEGPALRPVPVVTGQMWLTARETLSRIAEIGEANDIDFTIENLNPLDHPGVPLSRAGDLLSLIRAVGSPRITLNLDLYHAQKDGGNLMALLADCRDFVGEVQIADVPMRDVPGQGEVHYPNIVRAMKSLGYECSVGLEAWAPTLDDVLRFKTLFADFHGTGASAA